jgi:uncharacterized membrane protein
MEIINPFQMNDWDIKTLFKLILSLQIILWATVCLNLIGLNIPVVRQLTGLICLIFINGILLLRIFRIHKIGDIETVLYSVGLSIAVLMILGAIINFLYPLFGISHPLSVMPIMITETVLTILLCGLSYLRDGSFYDHSYMNVEGLMTPILFLCIIPFLAIFGTYMLNNYHVNTISMIMILFVGIVPVLVAFDKIIPKKLYPFALFTLALSLLYFSSLISTYITGWDINTEYYFSNLVVTNAHWNLLIPDRTNAMLSLVIMIPVLFNVIGMSVAGIFKIIYPLIFSLVPVGLYKIFKEQTDSKIGFLSVFLFISIFMFFMEMPYLARQEIGELFLVLLIMLIVEKKISSPKKMLLSMIFIISLILSHYSLDYIYLCLLIGILLIFWVRDSIKLDKHHFLSNLTAKIPGLNSFLQKDKGQNQGLSKRYYLVQLLLIFLFTAIYYKFVSSSELFNLTLYTLQSVFITSISHFMDLGTIQAVSIVQTNKSFLSTIALYLQLIIQFFIFIGIILLLFKRTNMKFKDDYSVFSVLNMILLGSLFVIPFLACALNTDRFYQISLIFLSPFFVVGGIGIFRLLNKIFRLNWTKKEVYNFSLKALSLLLIVSLLFNTGFIYEALNVKHTSMALSSDMDGPNFNGMEITGAQWLAETKNPEARTYADQYRATMLNSFNNKTKVVASDSKMEKGSYLYMGTFNIFNNEFAFYPFMSSIVQYFNDNDILVGKNKIYDDKGSQIFQ